MESTMFVLPEPFGPTIAVTPPSNRISVARANVLKPTRLSERRNNARSCGPRAGREIWRSRWSEPKAGVARLGAH